MTESYTLQKLLDSRKFADALMIVKQLCAKESSNIDHWNLAGDIYLQTLSWDKAINAYKEAIKLSPSNAHALLNIGRANHFLGDIVSAEKYFLAIVRNNPNDDVAYAELGTLYTNQNKPDKAVKFYYTASNLKPNNSVYLCNLGHALQTKHCYEEAINLYERASAISPNNAQIEINLAYAFSAINEFDKALQYYRKVQSLSPSLENAIVGEAEILEKTGKLEESYTVLKPLISRGTKNTGALCLYAMLSKHFDVQKNALAMINDGLKDTEKSASESARLHFNAGAVLDAIKQTDDAFHHYSQGNKLAYKFFDTIVHKETISHYINNFSPEAASRMAKASNNSTRPVFIVGMPRSGTSLVEQILASHPDIFGAGELPCIHEMVVNIVDNLSSSHIYPECCEELSQKQIDQLAGSYLSTIHSITPEHTRIVDKMPQNYLHLGLIRQLFPNAYIIHCRRNPLDTCLSCYFRLFSSGHEYTNDLATLGNYYIQYERLMMHWKNTLKIPMLEVCYDDLVQDQENQSRKLLAYCNLEWDEQCLNFHRTQRPVLSASYDTVRKPIFRDSLEKWKRYRHHIHPLMEILSEK